MSEKQLMCLHQNFAVSANVVRLVEEEGRPYPLPAADFTMDIQVKCADCDLPFHFKGLPFGCNLDGAACSVDGLEGRFALGPGPAGMFVPDERQNKGLRGFDIRRTD